MQELGRRPESRARPGAEWHVYDAPTGYGIKGLSVVERGDEPFMIRIQPDRLCAATTCPDGMEGEIRAADRARRCRGAHVIVRDDQVSED